MIASSIKSVTLKLASLLIACLIGMTSFAAIDVYDFDSVQQEAQYRGLIEELRCPKCQNQNLAGSDAPIAQDLKQKMNDFEIINDLVIDYKDQKVSWIKNN